MYVPGVPNIELNFRIPTNVKKGTQYMGHPRWTALVLDEIRGEHKVRKAAKKIIFFAARALKPYPSPSRA